MRQEGLFLYMAPTVPEGLSLSLSLKQFWLMRVRDMQRETERQPLLGVSNQTRYPTHLPNPADPAR